MYTLARPLLFCLDAERAHDPGIDLDRGGLSHPAESVAGHATAPVPTNVFGIAISESGRPCGRSGQERQAYRRAGGLGFGFIEIGTTTPRPQPGNPKPRMWRLPEHQAVINRLGFNNDGVDALLRNVEKARYAGVLGINIGKNKDTPNERAIDDYLFCLERVYAAASYVTVNISSPNTQGLRDLQQAQSLHRLIGRLREAQESLGAKHGARKPMLLKIAPDLSDSELDDIARELLAAKIDGLICTNTTIDRDQIEGARHAEQSGGLSGRPLFEKATQVLRKMADRVGGKIPLIGVGGIASGADAAAKIDAGAALVQFYTGMIYRGPGLIGECVEAIRARETN